jgi:hypothetical protein
MSLKLALDISFSFLPFLGLRGHPTSTIGGKIGSSRILTFVS